MLSLLAVYMMLTVIFRKRLKAEVFTEYEEEEQRGVDRPRLVFLSAVTLITFAGFVMSSRLGIKMCVPAVAAGLISVIVILSKERTRVKWILGKINWRILFFIMGLFIVMSGVASSGLLDRIVDIMPGFGEGETPSFAATSGLVAVLANLISDLPTIILITDIVPQTDAYFYTLSAAITLAGNATLLGSACNIIVSEKAAASGIRINFWKHMAVGIPVTVVTIAIQLMVHSFIL